MTRQIEVLGGFGYKYHMDELDFLVKMAEIGGVKMANEVRSFREASKARILRKKTPLTSILLPANSFARKNEEVF